MASAVAEMSICSRRVGSLSSLSHPTYRRRARRTRRLRVGLEYAPCSVGAPDSFSGGWGRPLIARPLEGDGGRRWASGMESTRAC